MFCRICFPFYESIPYHSYFHPLHIFRCVQAVDACLTLFLRGLTVLRDYSGPTSFRFQTNINVVGRWRALGHFSAHQDRASMPSNTHYCLGRNLRTHISMYYAHIRDRFLHSALFHKHGVASTIDRFCLPSRPCALLRCLADIEIVRCEPVRGRSVTPQAASLPFGQSCGA